MSYTKLNPQPSNLQADEVAVQLDDGTLVAVCASSTVASNSGDLLIVANARVINADGTSAVDALGQTMTTVWPHGSSDYEMTTLGNGDPAAGANVVKRCCMLAVLGEDTAPMWEDAYHMTALANASIRVRVQNSAHVGVINPAALL